MAWTVWILLAAALSVDGDDKQPKDTTVTYGGELHIPIPKKDDLLEFTAVNGSPTTVWDRKGRSTSRAKGHISGTGFDKKWILRKVNYGDQGTYVTKDVWKRESSVTRVTVKGKLKRKECVAGETLFISLEDLASSEAKLVFSGEYFNGTLVRDGIPLDHNPDFSSRIKVTSFSIEIEKVNTSDVGNYRLWNGQNQHISTTRLQLVDHHEKTKGSSWWALLLLLGIPAGVCCCCRKRICNDKSTKTTTIIQEDQGETLQPPPGPPAYMPQGPLGPPGSSPGYFQGYPDAATVYPPPNPGAPGQQQWSGQPGIPPNPGYGPGYPPQNPMYPPQNPMYPPQNPLYPSLDPSGPPGPPPQWSGPPNQSNPAAPGYNPVMYSGPIKEEIKMENVSPADPLLTARQTQVPPTDCLNSSDSGVQFNVEKGSKSNFL